MKPSDVSGIAAIARKDFETRKIAKEKLKILYSKYASVPDLNLFFQTAENIFPKLNCGLASVYLRDILGGGHIINGKFGEENHTFLLMENDTVVDITADQYGGPEIYVGPLRRPWSR